MTYGDPHVPVLPRMRHVLDTRNATKSVVRGCEKIRKE
jgi:hypothetical protein